MDTRLLIAIDSGKTEKALQLIGSGCLDVSGNFVRTEVLRKACLKGNAIVARALLERGGIDINAKDENGNTALWYACNAAEYRLAKFLIDNRASNIANNNGQTPFSILVCYGEVELADFMLKKGMINNINSTIVRGNTALFIACDFAQYDVVKFLIKNNAKNIANEHGETPFFILVQDGQLELVKLMFQKGLVSDINAMNEYGETALYMACRSGRYDVAKFLIENDAKNIAKENKRGETTPFFILVKNGQLELVNLMFQKGLVSDINAMNEYGETALDMACRFDRYNVVKFLIENDAKNSVYYNDVITDFFTLCAKSGQVELIESALERGLVQNIDAMDQYNETALQVACYSKQYDAAKVLVKYGAKNVANYNGQTPFMMLACGGEVELMNLMLEKGMVDDINAKNNSGETALQCACFCGSYESVKFLIENGAKDSADNNGMTAFKNVSVNSVELIKLLIEKGMVDDINMKNINGKTALYRACFNKNYDTVKFLMENGAKDSADNDGVTSFMLLACDGQVELMKFMLENEMVDINAKNKFNNTALEAACAFGHDGVIKFLVENGADIYDKKLNIFTFIKTMRDYQAGRKDTDGSDAYHLAMVNQEKKTCWPIYDDVLQKGNDDRSAFFTKVMDNTLHILAKENNWTEIKNLVKAGRAVSLLCTLDLGDSKESDDMVSNDNNLTLEEHKSWSLFDDNN